MLDSEKKIKVLSIAQELSAQGIIKDYKDSSERRAIKIFVYTVEEKDELRKEFELNGYITIDSLGNTWFDVLVDKETDIDWKSLIK